jgi:hypothetical protein
VQTWICLALGRWDDSLIGVPWLFCAAALGLAFYGQARVWGARPLPAMTFAYFLLSLPLLDTQVAIPGNADLWMATVYGLAAFSFFHWLRAGDRGQGMLALGFLAACAFVKVPGVAWMLTFGPALLVARRSWRALPFILGLPLLALGAVLARGLPKGVLDLPYLGHYKVAFHPDVWTAFAESAFSLASWHLLFYVVAGVALVRFRVFRSSRVFASMAMLVLAGFALVASVYSFSQLAEFALDFTQVNRAALPIVPVLLFVTLAAWVEPAPGRP